QSLRPTVCPGRSRSGVCRGQRTSLRQAPAMWQSSTARVRQVRQSSTPRCSCRVPLGSRGTFSQMHASRRNARSGC
ncbi:unnamed protein product, partial [Effrenium voratum]